MQVYFKMKKFIIVSAALLLSLSVWAQKRDLNIVYIGNSITHGVQLDTPETQAPPAVASAYLRQQPGIGSVEFSNQGVSGFTTVDFLPSTNTVFNKVEQAARSFQNTQALLIFSIKLGTNDSASSGPNGSPVSPEQYHDNLKTIMDRLLEDFPGCKIILQHPLWYSPNTYNGARYLQEGLTRLQSYFPQLERLAHEYAKTHPKQVYVADRTSFDYFKAHYQTDFIPEQGKQGIFYLHPNLKGAAVLGTIWGKEIYKDLK